MDIILIRNDKKKAYALMRIYLIRTKYKYINTLLQLYMKRCFYQWCNTQQQQHKQQFTLNMCFQIQKQFVQTQAHAFYAIVNVYYHNIMNINNEHENIIAYYQRLSSLVPLITINLKR